MYSPPKLAEITLLLEAANYYRVQRYENFCTKFIMNLLPDRLPTTDTTNLTLLVKGVKLARSYDTLSTILRPAFYGLARSWPPGSDGYESESDDEYVDPMSDDDETVNGDAEKPSALEKLDSADLVILLDIQKRLVFAWNDIEDLMEYKCNNAQCNKLHLGRMRHIRREMPFDPVRGVHSILSSSHVFSATNYCAESTRKVKELLRKERSKIWSDIKE